VAAPIVAITDEGGHGVPPLQVSQTYQAQSLIALIGDSHEGFKHHGWTLPDTPDW